MNHLSTRQSRKVSQDLEISDGMQAWTRGSLKLVQIFFLGIKGTVTVSSEPMFQTRKCSKREKEQTTSVLSARRWRSTGATRLRRKVSLSWMASSPQYTYWLVQSKNLSQWKRELNVLKFSPSWNGKAVYKSKNLGKYKANEQITVNRINENIFRNCIDSIGKNQR